MKPGDRLKSARIAAGFASVAEAARVLKMHPQNWADHEAGRRQIREKNARDYGRKLKISWIWLLTGHDASFERKLPLVGYVGAGAQVHAFPAEVLEYIDAPPGADADDVAFSIRGSSMSPFRDGGVILATPLLNISDVVGRLGVVDLEDGTRWFKRVIASSLPGCHTLVSLLPGVDPMMDVRITTAARFHVYVEPI